MFKKIHFFFFVALFITLIAAISGYLWKGGDKRRVKNINRALALQTATKGAPALKGGHATQKIAAKPTTASSKATLTPEALAAARRRFSATKSAPASYAGAKEKTIILANRTISVPDNPRPPTALSSHQSLTRRSTLPYIIHFGKPITEKMRQQARDSGATLRGYLPNYAFLVEVTAASLKMLAQTPSVNYMTEYTVDDKVQPFLAELVKTENAEETIPVSIQTLDSQDIAPVENYLKQRDAAIESVSRLPEWGVINAVVALRDLDQLAAMGEVQWIEERVTPELLSDSAANGEHLNAVSMWNEWFLTGRGQIVGHADTGVDSGDEATIHADFKGRIKVFYDLANGGDDAADYDGHGTHTAGLICGNGGSSGGQYKGIAHEARLVAQCVVDKHTGYFTGISDLFALYLQSHDAGATIHSDSWGAEVNGEYDSWARATDLFAWRHKDFLTVCAAGNSGTDSNRDGVVDLNNIASPGTSKNVLTVGATENDRFAIPEGYRGRTYGNTWSRSFRTAPINGDFISWSATTSPYMQGMAAFSSRGPTADNRIKPELCAPGTDVISVKSSIAGASSGWGVLPSNNNYCYNGGTSMSTPLIAGSVALIRQYMVERAGIEKPSSALLKAAMIAGAKSLAPGQYGTDATQEIPFTSPNNVEGWGQSELEWSVHPAGLMIKLIDDIAPETGETNIFEITVEKSGEPLDIVLSWIDYPGTAGGAVTLINDLNLNVVTPATDTLFPNDGESDDSRNTIERISLASATNGVYQIMVIGQNVPRSGGTAALYARGAINEQPIIAHEPTRDYNSDLPPYSIDFKVQSLNILTNNELNVFFANGTANSATGEWRNAAVRWSTNANYQALVPRQSEDTFLHYYIKFTNELYSVELPQNAIASNSFFSMNVRAPVALIVEGNPDQYSVVSPNYGTNTLLKGAEYTASASIQSISSKERRVAHDWNGSGDIPASGSNNPFNISLSQESTLTWNWRTQYLLTRSRYFKNLNQTILSSTAWFWKDEVMPEQSTPELLEVSHGYNYQELYAFYGWSLNNARWPNESSPSINPLGGLVMSNAFTLKADYMEFDSDQDGDSLYDWWELKYYGELTATDDPDEDSDGDLWSNRAEALDNTNPLDPESVPTPPVITVNPLDPFQSAHSPWSVTAVVTDNFVVVNVTLEWREKGDTEWRQTEMEWLEGNLYSGVIEPASHGAKRVDYRVTAYDIIGYYDASFASVSPIYSVIGDYEAAWVDFSPASLGLAELTEQATNYTLNITNLAGADLIWTGVLLTASQTFEASHPGWHTSGISNIWNISTRRAWNGEPVWYCGDADTQRYPNKCFASLDSPVFTVAKDDVLLFRHWMDFEEYGADMPNYYWDGARVMISTNNGASFTQLDPVGGYNGFIVDNADSPFVPDMPCFGDTGGGWQSVKVNLAEFSGSSAIIRFQFGADRYTTDEGWYVGNVTILSSDETRPLWFTETGVWNGILPDMWSAEFGFNINPLLMEKNSEHPLCVKLDGDGDTENLITELTIRRGFSITGALSGCGVIDINDPFIFRDEISSVDIQADHGSYITNVTINGIFQPGDYSHNDSARNYTTQPVTNNLRYSVDFDLRLWNLIINSRYGAPTPAVGYHYVTHGTLINAHVATPVTDTNPMIRHSADEIILRGVDPLSTAAGELTFNLTNHTILTWNWSTNYLLKATSSGNGLVMPANAWYAAGSSGSTTGYPARYHHFDKWEGDITGAEIDESLIFVTMDGPKTVSASFAPNLTPTHGVPEIWLASYGFRGDMEEAAEGDQDGDGAPTWKEWRADTDPTDITSLLRLSSPRTAGPLIRLTWIGGLTRTQRVQSAAVPAGPWRDIHTNLPPTPITNSIRVPKTESERFFRVVVP